MRSKKLAADVEGDFTDPGSFAPPLDGVDRLFLLIPSSADVEAQQRNVVAAARRRGVKHIVKLSQFAADEHAPGLYWLLVLSEWAGPRPGAPMEPRVDSAVTSRKEQADARAPPPQRPRPRRRCLPGVPSPPRERAPSRHDELPRLGRRDRPGAGQAGAGRRERPAAPATDHPDAIDHAAAPHPVRPGPAGSPGEPRPGLAPSVADRPAGDGAALAPRRLPAGLALAVGYAVPATARTAGDGRPDPADGPGEPALGRRAHPRRAPQARHRGR